MENNTISELVLYHAMTRYLEIWIDIFKFTPTENVYFEPIVCTNISIDLLQNIATPFTNNTIDFNLTDPVALYKDLDFCQGDGYWPTAIRQIHLIYYLISTLHYKRITMSHIIQ